MGKPRDRIECAVSLDRRFEKYLRWNKRFQAGLVHDRDANGEAGRVRSYAHYLKGHEPVYGVPLSPADDALLGESAAFRAGVAQAQIDVPDLTGFLHGLRAVLGTDRKLHIRAIAEKLDNGALETFVNDLYRVCDDVWWQFYDKRLGYVIWNVVLRRDGVGLKPPKAMSWHYDTHYPKRYCKFLVGLNASEEHGGGTELLSPEDSARFTDSTGYVGYRPGERISEEGFDSLATDRRTVFRPNLGDTLLFWPARVLHRGLMPRKGQRLMLFVSACPISRSLMSSRMEITRMAFTTARTMELGYDMPIWWGAPRPKPAGQGTEAA